MPVIKCSRCNRRHRNQDDWNLQFQAGRVIAVICPNCQTTEEHLEAAINEATIDYGNAETIVGVTPDFLREVLADPADAAAFNLQGWADHINRQLAAEYAAGADVSDPEVFGPLVDRLVRDTATEYFTGDAA